MAGSPSVARAVASAVRALKPEPVDAAAVALAKRLAGDLDAAVDSESVARLSGRLLPVLTALGLTPAARDAVAPGKGAGGGGGSSKLDQLRERRESRAARAAAADVR